MAKTENTWDLRYVLHGAFGIELEDKQITLKAPDCPEHVYKCGLWGREYRIPEGMQIPLLNPKAQPSQATALGDVEPATNPILYQREWDTSEVSPKVFCTLTGPLPNDIQSLRRVKKKEKGYEFFSGSDAKEINNKLNTLALVHVMIYRFDVSVKVGDVLPRLIWTHELLELSESELAPKKLATKRPITLHVYAEPDSAVGPHPAFQMVVKLFKSTDLDVDEYAPTKRSDLTTALKYFHGWEEDTQTERAKLKHVLNEPFPLPSPEEGHNPANCGKLLVDNRTALARRA